ncbi:MAG TPA: tetratricopeptide repeat protein, partial [Bacteroidetes bacterium]|nr:tetratricopeptide repeat protein [Bacteroidota bacterium]
MIFDHLRNKTFFAFTLLTLLTVALSGQTRFGARNLARIIETDDSAFRFTETIIALSRDGSEDLLGEPFDSEAYLLYIRKMAQKVGMRIDRNDPPRKIVSTISSYLYDEIGFRTDYADTNGINPRNLLLNTVLDRKKGYCLSLSLPWLIIAEELDLPIYGVAAPGHFFVRFDDGVIAINIETTAGGQIIDDDYYLEKYKLKDDTSFYMRNLTPRQVVGVFLNNYGNCYRRKEKTREALLALDGATRINPDYAEAHTNLGIAYFDLGDYKRAVIEHRKAIALNANLP